MKVFNSLFDLLRRNKKTLLLIVIVSTLTLLISSAISIWLSSRHNLNIPTVGNIKTIGIEAYWDPNYENRTETVDWNTVWPGSTNNITLYIRSISNVKATLHLTTSNISPAEVSEYLKISWNYEETPLNPNETIQVTLFLSASTDQPFIRYLIDNEVTDFSMDINIILEE